MLLDLLPLDAMLGADDCGRSGGAFPMSSIERSGVGCAEDDCAGRGAVAGGGGGADGADGGGAGAEENGRGGGADGRLGRRLISWL
jgi:hypothetical protein